MKFCLIADFHYKKGMYIPTIRAMEKVIDESEKQKVDFIIQCGDFCNDYIGSPELINLAVKNNKIPFFGVYGNHELESPNNTMEFVTPRLTNRPDNVVWGTENGKINNGEVGYYYFDFENFRFICLDNNYSINPKTNEWEHNKPNSWCCPSENIREYSLGDTQLAWFKSVLNDSANKNKNCIIIVHASFIDEWRKHSDNAIVQGIINKINEEKPNTVISCFNGHHHTNRHKIINNVLYFDVNSTINGLWEGGHTTEHYTLDQTYQFVEFDDLGNETGLHNTPIIDAWMSKDTWYFESPLYAIVDIDKDLNINIKGTTTKWVYDLAPTGNYPGVMPYISSLTFNPNKTK